MSLRDYVVIYDGVIQMGIPPWPVPGTINLSRDGVPLGAVTGLDYIGTGVDASVGAGVGTIDFPEVASATVLEVHPDFIDDNNFGQYATFAAALVQAKALIVADPTAWVRILLKAHKAHPLVAKQIITDHIVVEFEAIAYFDFTGFAGEGTLFEMSGTCALVRAPLYYTVAHPFVDGIWVKVVDSGDPLHPTSVLLQECWISDGIVGLGFTKLVNVQGGVNNPVCNVQGGIYTGVQATGLLVADGNCQLELNSGVRTVCWFGPSIATNDVAGVGPALRILTDYIWEPIGAYQIVISPNTGGINLQSSILKPSMTNIPYGRGIETMLNAEQMFQQEYPHRSLSDPVKYSLDAGLKEIHLRLRDPVGALPGTDLNDGDLCYQNAINEFCFYESVRAKWFSVDEKRMNFSRAFAPAGALTYFDGMASDQGISVLGGTLIQVFFDNANILTRDVKIWSYDGVNPSSLICTLSLVAQKSNQLFGTVDIDFPASTLIAGIDAGTGDAVNASLQIIAHTRGA